MPEATAKWGQNWRKTPTRAQIMPLWDAAFASDEKTRRLLDLIRAIG
jgi:hypothetical protein